MQPASQPLNKVLLLCEHLKANRLEYLLLLATATILGWTQRGVEYVQGVCA
jgi:hypothetical protein